MLEIVPLAIFNFLRYLHLIIMKLTEIEKELKGRLDFFRMTELSFFTANGKVKCGDLISLCRHQDQQIAFRASWVLEFFAHDKPELFINHLPDFLVLYPKILNQSVQRCFTKILMLLTAKKFLVAHSISPVIFDECLSASFDWLINPKTPVAVQANALDVIFQLSPYHDWVLEELKVILQDKLVSGSPALTSRAKRILKKK